MNKTDLPFGTAIAQARRESSPCFAPPSTLADMMTSWKQNPLPQDKMLRTTCVRLADYLDIPVAEITLDALDRSKKGFRAFLEGRKFRENSIRTYVNHLRILLREANRAGWTRTDSLSEEWRRVVLLAGEHGCGEVARYVAELRSYPGEVTFDDVEQWLHYATKQGASRKSAVPKRSKFWRILRDLGFAHKLPVYILREKNYGLPFDRFPVPLRKETEELLKWKLAVYAWDRPKGAGHRPPTAKRLKTVISAVLGYAMNIEGHLDITSLSDLAQRPIIGGFIQWCITEREVKGQSLQRNLRLLAAALGQHPRYEMLDLSWFKPLLDGIPIESDSLLKIRKASRCLDYFAVAAIPGKMHADRRVAAAKGSQQLAQFVMESLLMRWLTVLPWRQRNIRECRIGGSRPNLFREPLPPVNTIDMPEWAAAEQRANPKAAFWQFPFSSEETKTGCTVHALLPRQLINALEEYLEQYRPKLLRGQDPGTLLLNHAGRPMTINQVICVVGKNSVKYAERRVTPHIYRDMVALAWLRDHPKDYLTLSKLLWHLSPNMVIKTYGSLFNESSGVRMMESWLEEREQRTEI